MATNRIIYLLCLAVSAVFYFASGEWSSWVLLVLVAVLPWVSLIFSLPAMLGSRVDVRLPQKAEQGENALMHLRIDAPAWLPAPDVQLRLNLRTRDRERDIRYLSRLSRTDGVLSLPTEDCGAVYPAFQKARVYDFLGIFHLRVRTPKLEPMAVLPLPRIPEPMPNLEQVLNQQLKPRPGGGFSEIHDHRPYRPGDPIKGIHWKLSLKTDELIVREPMDAIRREILLAVRTPRGPELRNMNLGNLRYLSGWLLDRGVAHSVLWMEGDSPVREEIKDEDSLLRVLVRTCLAPEDSAALPEQIPFKADWLCRIGREGDAT